MTARALEAHVLPLFETGVLRVPVAATFPLADWRAAMEISLGGQARGKLVLLP